MTWTFPGFFAARCRGLFCLLFSFLTPFANGVTVEAQSPGAASIAAKPAAKVAGSPPVGGADSIAHVTLGQSAVPLFGPWKFTVGDSPIDPATGKPLWAEPDFDDSEWENVDLTPKNGSVDPGNNLSGYVPGWTAKGHSGYYGYAWYRIQVQARSPEGLALAGPTNVDDAYQVFDNGELVGHFGDFTGAKPVAYYEKPKMFSLAQPGGQQAIAGNGETGPNETAIDGVEPRSKGMAESTRVLAFRVWMSPLTISLPGAGGMHSAPVLGETDAVAAYYQNGWLELVRNFAATSVRAVVLSLLAVVVFSFILFDRSDPVYLWMGGLFFLIALEAALIVINAWTEQLSIQGLPLLESFTIPLMYAAWVMVLCKWFGLRQPWVPRLVMWLTPLSMITNIVSTEIFGFVSHEVAVRVGTFSRVFDVLFYVLLLLIVYEGIRRQGVEGWLVLPLALMQGVYVFSDLFDRLNIQTTWSPFGVKITLSSTIANLLMVLVFALLLLRRLLRSVKRQRHMALDVKSAQEVQQVILPESRMTLPGLAIESEYRPAREVGGDFFQIVPNAADGSLLIVAGDVAGKGLKAGMLVALLIGTIRTAVEYDSDPAAILAALNRRLLGRGDAHATCLAMRITADGTVTLANAGHIAPYLNGQPVAMEGALPLGIMEGAEFSVMHFKLKPDDKLMLLSDGVAEATDANGKLFGFERTQGLLRKATTAAEVAGAAQAFGQEDDISVIAVTRTEVLQPVRA